MQPSIIVTLILSLVSGIFFIASFFDEETKGTFRIVSVLIIIVGFFVLLNSRDRRPVARPGEPPPPEDEDDFEVK